MSKSGQGKEQIIRKGTLDQKSNLSIVTMSNLAPSNEGKILVVQSTIGKVGTGVNMNLTVQESTTSL